MQYKVVLNPLQGIPQPQKNVFVSPTNKEEIQKSIKYTEYVNTMNQLYNTDQGWSFRIFAGIGQSAVSFGEGEAVGYAVGKVGQGIKYLKNMSSSAPKPTFVVPEPPPILNASVEINQTFATSSAASRYPGVFSEYAKQTVAQLQRMIRSTRQTIAQHESWLKNPLSKPDMTAEKWNSMSDQARQGLLRKWGNDIERNKSYLEIAEQLLKSKK